MKNTIINYYQEIALTDISRDIVDLVITDNADLIGDLRIVGYEHLETFEIHSLRSIRSLTISGNPLLKLIVFEYCACYNVKRVDISSKIHSLSSI